MGAVRIVLLIIHISAAGMWISEEVIGLILKRLINKNKGQAAELTLASAALTIFKSFGPLASMGILITGIGMTLTNGWVLLGIGGFTPPWLLIKQIVYIGLFVMVMVWIQPHAQRLEKAFGEATAAGSMTEEARALVSRLWTLVSIHSLLVLVNIILAVWKPSFG
jgi:hypothetical protein